MVIPMSTTININKIMQPKTRQVAAHLPGFLNLNLTGEYCPLVIVCRVVRW